VEDCTYIIQDFNLGGHESKATREKGVGEGYPLSTGEGSGEENFV